MPLMFSDEQIREATGQALDAPRQVEDLRAQKEKAIQIKQDFKELDETHNIYTNFYADNISKYHGEVRSLNGVLYTDPLTATIDAGGRLSPGNIYFPSSPIWVNMPPKLTDDVNGNPTSAYTPTENSLITQVITLVGLLKTGFNDGSASQTTQAPVNATTVTVTSSTGFSTGNRVVAYSSGGYAYGTVASTTATTITVTVIYGSLTAAGVGATITNVHNGFTLTQRETNAGVSAAQLPYINGLKTELDNVAITWNGTLQSQVLMLMGNGDTGASGTQNTAAKNTTNANLATLTGWQNAPATGVGVSRFGALLDTDLLPLTVSRPTYITARTAEVLASIGSVTQAGDGSVTGTGNALKFFNSLNMRLNKTGGTLRSFYQQDFAILTFDQKIALAQSAAAQAASTFSIKVFSTDATNTGFVKLKDVDGLLVGQDVQVMSNTKQAISATIISINDLEVELSASISSEYVVSDLARLVRQI